MADQAPLFSHGRGANKLFQVQLEKRWLKMDLSDILWKPNVHPLHCALTKSCKYVHGTLQTKARKQKSSPFSSLLKQQCCKMLHINHHSHHKQKIFFRMCSTKLKKDMSLSPRGLYKVDLLCRDIGLPISLSLLPDVGQ